MRFALTKLIPALDEAFDGAVEMGEDGWAWEGRDGKLIRLSDPLGMAPYVLRVPWPTAPERLDPIPIQTVRWVERGDEEGPFVEVVLHHPRDVAGAVTLVSLLHESYMDFDDDSELIVVAVTGKHHDYTVVIDSDGLMSCDCPAGKKRWLCHHVRRLIVGDASVIDHPDAEGEAKRVRRALRDRLEDPDHVFLCAQHVHEIEERIAELREERMGELIEVVRAVVAPEGEGGDDGK